MAGYIISESSAKNDAIFGKSQDPIRALIEKKAEAFEKESVLDRIFSQHNTENYADKLTSMSGMDGFKPVAEGGSYPHDTMEEGPSKIIEQVTWKDSFTVTQEMVEDSKLIDFRRAPAAFIAGFYRTKEQLGAGLLGSAVAGNDFNYYGKTFSTKTADKANLFYTAHGGNTTQSNKFAGAFDVDMLSKIETEMQNFRDDSGNVLAVSPDTIIIPNDAMLKKEVFAAIGADKDPATANNGFNFQFGRWNVIVWAYLNQFMDLSTDKPFILMDSRYNEEYIGGVWMTRKPLSIKSYIDENTDNNIWKGRARFSAGFNDWRAFAVGGVTGGTSL